MQGFLLELKRGARRLLGAWRLALVCIVFLGVAIGSTTTVFSVVNAALIRPLPFPEPNRLVGITEDDGTSPGARILVSTPTLAALRRGTAAFDVVGAYADESAIVAVGENVQTLFVTGIDSSVLPTLRVRPQLGAAPTASDYAVTAKVALVSDNFWRTKLKASRDAIGKPILVNDTAYQVLGVMPPWFAFPYRTDLWIPLNERESRWWPGKSPSFSVVARLRPGMTHAQARQELAVVEARLRRDDPAHWRRMHIVMRDDAVFRISRSWKRILFLFLGGVGGVLIIACVNVGTLLSMRASEQQGSIAVRAAMGATPGRLLMHAIAEPVLLVAAAAALGLALTVFLVPLVVQLAGISYLPNWFRADVDYRVLLFVSGVAGFAVALVGVRAGLQSLRLDVVQRLRGSADGGHTSSAVSRGGARGVILQVALSVVLAVTSTLVATTYHRVTTVDPGYAQSRMIRVLLQIDERIMPNDQQRWERIRELAESVRQLPGVEAATLRGELTGYRTVGADALRDAEVYGDGGRPAVHPEWIVARKVVVDPNYFSTLRISVLRGRAFSASDAASGPPAVVLSARAAEMLWPRQEALGRPMRIGSNGPQLTVVGVVGDVRRAGTQLGQDGMGVWPIPMLYLPSTQAVGATPAVYARFAGSADAVRSRLGAEVLRVLGPTPFMVLTPDMEQDRFLILLRMSGVLFGASAAVACLLAGLGAYAVVRFRVQQQQREIGIRMALGATTNQIRMDVSREVLVHGGTGLVAGLVGSAVLGQAMRATIWGVSRFSPIVYGAVTAAVLLLLGAASYAASRRASRVDPASAMRA